MMATGVPDSAQKIEKSSPRREKLAQSFGSHGFRVTQETAFERRADVERCSSFPDRLDAGGEVRDRGADWRGCHGQGVPCLPNRAAENRRHQGAAPSAG